MTAPHIIGAAARWSLAEDEKLRLRERPLT
jgi:hypothetical protein